MGTKDSYMVSCKDYDRCTRCWAADSYADLVWTFCISVGQIFAQTTRRSGLTSSNPVLLSCLTAAILLPAANAEGQIFGTASAVQDMRGMHLPDDRIKSRGLSDAQDRIQSGAYSQALQFLDELLQADEDAFHQIESQSGQFVGLKSEARRLLGSLPKEGRDVYRQIYGTTAQKLLIAAVENSDFPSIQKVARQYFHTPAGFEATLILGLEEAAAGRPLSAGVYYNELLRVPEARAQFGPQLYLLAAVASHQAGDKQNSLEILAELHEQFPQAQISVAGRLRTLPSGEPARTELLQQLSGRPSAQRPESLKPWLTYRGNAARTADTQGGVPHSRVRWSAYVANHPGVESLLSELQKAYSTQRVALLPAVQPLAVNNTVIYRTTDRLSAVDFETGRLIWEVRPEPDEEFEQLVQMLDQPGASSNRNAVSHQLERRMWDDHLFGGLSSDGERVYVVRGLPLKMFDATALTQFAPFMRRRGQAIGDEFVPTNVLTALDLRSEGKRVWEIRGDEVAGELSGAFFLGPPLAIDGQLYALAEIKSGIHLVELKQSAEYPFWELGWIQQLANLELGIALDPQRRLAGAVPSYKNGILVCPTAAGVVVATDLAKRSLLWAYTYGQVSEASNPQEAMFQAMEALEEGQPRQNDSWLDNSALIVGNRVLLTPPESNELHCLDLLTGKRIWKRPRGDGLFVAAVDNDLALVIGERAAEVVRLADGKPGWQGQKLRFDEQATPSGKGFLADGIYYLPLTTGEVVGLDIAGGEVVRRGKTELNAPLGNLVAYQGSVISQSATTLAKFDDRATFLRTTQAALRENSNDPVALRNLGELAASEARYQAAVENLLAAHELAPDDVATADLLVQVVIEGLSTDFDEFKQHVSVLEGIVRTPEQQVQFNAVMAQGYAESGDWEQALQRLLDVAELDQSSPRVQHRGHWKTRRSRWVQAQLVAIVKSLPGQDQGVALDQIREFLLRQSDSSLFLDYFAAIPGLEHELLRHTSMLIDRGQLLRAQLELLDLLESDRADVQRAATVVNARLMLEIGRLDEALEWVSVLRSDFGDVACWQGRTGAEWAEELLADKPIGSTSFETNHWPQGVVRVKQESQRPGDWHDQFHSVRMEGGQTGAGERYQLATDTVHSSLILLDPRGQICMSMPLGNRGQRPMTQVLRSVHAKQRGFLQVVSVESSLLALDTTNAHKVVPQGAQGVDQASRPIWKETFSGQILVGSQTNRISNRRRIAARKMHRTFGYRHRERDFIVDSDNHPVGWIGPVTKHGVVFQQGNLLKCVDSISGEAVWERGDLPTGCALYGDSEYVFAQQVDSDLAIVFRSLDGERIGTRQVPLLAEQLVTHGRQIIRVQDNLIPEDDPDSPVMRVSGVDALTGDDLWSRTLPVASQVRLVAGRYLGALHRSTGLFEFLELPSGKTKFEVQLNKEPVLSALYLLLDRERLFVIAHRPHTILGNTDRIYAIQGSDFPVVTGRVYALDRETGQNLWPTPATVARQGISLRQGSELPLLTFVSARRGRRSTGTRDDIRILCLDKATGRSVLRKEIPQASTPRARVYPDPRQPNSIMLALARDRFQLEFTGEPIPPEPPADSRVEDIGGESKKSLNVFGIFGS